MKLKALIETLPAVKETQVSTDGYVIWSVWSGDLNAVVQQTITDYGGLPVIVNQEQGLWFFFSGDVFLASGRLDSWAKFNNVNHTLIILPATLHVGNGREISVSMDGGLIEQDLEPSEGFKILVHPKAKEYGAVPGITFKPTPPLPGLSNVDWTIIEADSRLQYKASLGWYCLLRPLGNPLDKAFQVGWRDFFTQLENILQRNKFRYTVHEYFLLIPLETLRNLKSWCKDYLTLVQRLKETAEIGPVDAPNHYWPCVIAIVDRKGLNFSNDLPQRVNIDWDQLMPDHPHMSNRNGLLLGEGFNLHGVRFSSSGDMADWCSISLLEEGARPTGMLPSLVPNSLVAGRASNCFYCGQRSHQTGQCPTRNMEELEPDLWRKIAFMDFDLLKQTSLEIDAGIARGDQGEVTRAILNNQGTQGLLVRGIFDVNVSAQYRMMRRLFMCRGKEYPKGLEDISGRDDNPIWALLDSMPDSDLIPLDKELGTLTVRYPRDYRPRSLQGFVALERGDINRAQHLWREGETYSASPMLQGWHRFLEGRLHETQGRFHQAISLYDEVLRICPAWLDASYRKIVCQVKTGFAEQGFNNLLRLMDRDPNYFNKVLLDPEMERGHIIMLTGLHTAWANAEARLSEEKKALERLKGELKNWFPEGSEFSLKIIDRIEALKKLGEKRNYVPYQNVIQGRSGIEKDMQLHISADGRDFRTRFKNLMERLMIIRDETAWLPFSRSFMEFNKAYNQCAINLNWAVKANFQIAEYYKRAQVLIQQEEDRLKRLEARLKVLRIVRDFTLFFLTTGKTFLFIWLPMMLFIVAGIPLAIFYYGQDTAGSPQILRFLSDNRFDVQKTVGIVVTMFAFAIAALRTTFAFEKIKNKVFAKAREDMIVKQKRRKELLEKMMNESKLAKNKNEPSAKARAAISAKAAASAQTAAKATAGKK